MPNDWYLQLSVRSSLPLKHWLILGNGVGIIDADYYNNPDNEGEILARIRNCSDETMLIHKGDRFMQGIFAKHFLVDNDDADGERTGGVGSTAK